MNVLSLFDGMSCGQIALERIGIKYENYFSCEIDRHAIQVTQANYPNTIQLGDVTKVDFKSLPTIDLLIGGSPCQGFSFGGKQLNFEDPRSKLFFEYLRAIEECSPKYFLLENVRMKKQYQDVITKYLGVEPMAIDSNLVSAQNRYRLYWTNIPGVTPPKDKGAVLKDILSIPGEPFNYSSSGRGNGVVQGRLNPATKSLTLTKTGYTRRSYTGVFDPKKLTSRPLTLQEMCRLQTVDEEYFDVEGFNKSKIMDLLGNGWTVDVIAHIFSFIGGEDL